MILCIAHFLKKVVALTALLFVAGQALGEPPKVIIHLSNNSALQHSKTLISITWKDIIKKYPGIDTNSFRVMDASSRKELPYQLEYRGYKEVQSLLVQVSIEPKATRKLWILSGKAANVFPKTYARYVPERYDDFAWENDKVAFRMYGKALESRKDNAWGIDVWSKRTSRMVINDWYKSGDYHADHGEGMDYYSVGLTLGAGDIAPFVNDSIYFSKNYHHWKMLDNGPLRSTFQLGYDAWDVAGESVEVTKTISLDAGSQMNRVETTYRYKSKKAMPVVIGIVQRKKPGTHLIEAKSGIMGYWEPEHGANGITGVGVITLQSDLAINVAKGHLLAHTAVLPNQPFVYYNGAAWNKANEITSADQWLDYLKDFRQKLAEPLNVSVR